MFRSFVHNKAVTTATHLSLFFHLSLLATMICSHRVSAETVYDTFGTPFVGGWENQTSEQMTAQPFLVGDNDTVTSVTLGMSRAGQPNGVVHIDIYDDSGLGTPGVSVGRLGSIDPLLIGSRLDSFSTFDTPVSGLTPNEQYYVVYSEEGGTNLSAQQAIYWNGSGQNNGAFGVGEALGILPPTISTDWHTVRNFPTFGGPPFSVWHWARIEAVTADFNGDGALNTADIDVLSERVRVGSTDAIFDLNADGEVNDADRAFWVEDLAGTVFGDADFDGTVQFSDFLALSSHFGQPGGWGQGDFDGDGEVNFTDFLILSVNFDEGANAAAAAVPEPTGVYLAMFGVLGLMGFRRSQ